MNLHNYEDAVADFKAVVELDPQNKAAKNQMAIASHKIKQIRDKEKKTYAGMFDRFASADAKVCETIFRINIDKFYSVLSCNCL